MADDVTFAPIGGQIELVFVGDRIFDAHGNELSVDDPRVRAFGIERMTAEDCEILGEEPPDEP